jgi:hypothetical protein
MSFKVTLRAAIGRRLTINFVATDDCSGDPVNLEDAQIKVWLKSRVAATIEKSTGNGVVTTDAQNGEFTATFGESEMEALDDSSVVSLEASAELLNQSVVQLGVASVIMRKAQQWD